MGIPEQSGDRSIPGPHLLPQHRRVQAALEGGPLHLGPGGSVIAIQDPKIERWAIYPGGLVPGAWWASEADVFTFSSKLVAGVLRRAAVARGLDSMLADLIGGE